MMPPNSFRLAIALALGCVMSSSFTVAQGKTVKRNEPLPEQARQQLLALENQWLKVEDDPDALEAILAPDFLHVVPAGIITKNEQLTYMRKHPSPKQSSEKHFENMHARVYGTVGIVNGVVVAKEAATTRRTLFTDVFAYRDGKWQAVSAQELPMAETK